MRFAPKSEKQIQEERFPVLSPGRYGFEITDASDEVSKKGNPMIVLRMKILDQGFSTLCYLNDYLMESMAFKLRHAAYACGLGSHYDSGELHAKSFVGKTGFLELIIQKDKSGQYPDKNAVHDYIQDQQPAMQDDWSQEPPEWVR